MQHVNIFSLSITLITAFVVLQCTDPVSAPPNIALEDLLTAPETLTIAGQELILKTSLWRDFQPVSPPDGHPLIALIYIVTADRSDLPAQLNPEAVYIVYQDQVWKSFFSTEYRSPQEIRPFRITKIARDGPKWGPDVQVEVIVRLWAGNDVYLLRAGDQTIGSTW